LRATPPMRLPRWWVVIPHIRNVGADLRVCPFRHDVCLFAMIAHISRQMGKRRCKTGRISWQNAHISRQMGQTSPQNRANFVAKCPHITANGANIAAKQGKFRGKMPTYHGKWGKRRCKMPKFHRKTGQTRRSAPTIPPKYPKFAKIPKNLYKPAKIFYIYPSHAPDTVFYQHNASHQTLRSRVVFWHRFCGADP